MKTLISKETPEASTQSAPILITAATRWEALPLRARFNLARKGRQLYSGLAGGHRVELLRTGIGPQAAAGALFRIDCALSAPSLIISSGFAGALQNDLRTGDLVAEELTPCPATAELLRWAAARIGAVVRFGSVAHSDYVLSEPEDKLSFGQRTGALAVDMESSAIRSWAGAHGLPALALRVILDEARFALPRTLPAGEDPLSLARYALNHPASLPRLTRLWLLQRRAAAILASALQALLEAI